MSYAGRIGHCDGVKIFFTKGENQKVNPVIKIVYYAWNNRTFSPEGYGTTDLNIKVLFSPSVEQNKEFDELNFGTIQNSVNGECQLRENDQLPCGRVVGLRSNKNGDHKYNEVLIELNDAFIKRFSRTVTLMRYSTHVNYDQNYNDIIGMVIEEKSGHTFEAPEAV